MPAVGDRVRYVGTCFPRWEGVVVTPGQVPDLAMSVPDGAVLVGRQKVDEYGQRTLERVFWAMPADLEVLEAAPKPKKRRSNGKRKNHL